MVLPPFHQSCYRCLLLNTETFLGIVSQGHTFLYVWMLKFAGIVFFCHNNTQQSSAAVCARKFRQSTGIVLKGVTSKTEVLRMPSAIHVNLNLILKTQEILRGFEMLDKKH